jgi:hypothetical protein
MTVDIIEMTTSTVEMNIFKCDYESGREHILVCSVTSSSNV